MLCRRFRNGFVPHVPLLDRRLRGRVVRRSYLLTSTLLLLLLSCTLPSLHAQNVSGYDQMEEPLLFLLREPAVHQALKLTSDQQRALTEFNQQQDGQLLMSRNWEPERSQKLYAETTKSSRDKLATLLESVQRNRLTQITLRIRGISCVMLPAVAEQLRLTETQRTQIPQILAKTRQATDELRQQLADAKTTHAAAADTSVQLRTEEQREILAQLTGEQRQQLKQLLGETFELQQLGQVRFKAPGLSRSAQWINSSPLAMENLRGKVVAVHFWAFGCHNCIQNYPWYKEWQSKYSPRGLTIVGIHTPETSREREFSSLQEVVEQEGFEFPVLADMDSQTWNAWGNSMWPSVYLVDKQGRIRYWWYGEMNWQGAGGQKIMAQRIEELLTES